ncbi:MAG: hypothetical protein KatS3mg101_0265 [Patescibacteria group bacterium]|nr:MAG: hypothetical protein KatS3mg101_0265 [Patescibacteria group bacterium]
MLTIKSDDMLGERKHTVLWCRGRKIPDSSVPETFKLLVRKLNGLGLGLEAYSSEEGSEGVEEEEEAEEEIADIAAGEVLPETGAKEFSEEEAEPEE